MTSGDKRKRWTACGVCTACLATDCGKNRPPERQTALLPCRRFRRKELTAGLMTISFCAQATASIASTSRNSAARVRLALFFAFLPPACASPPRSGRMTVPLRRIITHFRPLFRSRDRLGLTPSPSCVPGVRKQSCVMRRCVRMTSNSSSGGGGGAAAARPMRPAARARFTAAACLARPSRMYEVGARALRRLPRLRHRG